VTRSDEELAIELLLEKSVLVHPGHFYDFPSDGYLVLSLITAREDFADGIKAVLEKLSS
jgi:aspartate/methionine/tyrosine aminotransferase